MTTFTFEGIKSPINAPGSSAPLTSTMTLVVSDGFRFDFTSGQSDPELTEIFLSAAAGSQFSLQVDGVEIDSNWALAMTRIDRAGGDVNDTNLLALFFNSVDPAADAAFLFEMSGPALPTFATLTALGTYLDSRPINPLWSAPFLEGAAIDPAGLSSLIGVSQDDLITLAGRSWTGPIRSGLGNDTVSGTGAGDVIDLGAGRDVGRGGGGADRILGLGGNDTLIGGAGNDTLTGGAGADVLDGGLSDDRLTGGGGADRFIFRPGYGRETVVDFADGIDKIDLTPYNLTEDEALALTAEVGGDVIFTLAGGDRLIVLNTTIAALQGDFIL